MELEASYTPLRDLAFTASYTFIDAIMIESDDPALVGKRVRQVPRHQYVLRGSFDRSSILSTSIQGRFIGDRFEDDLNTLPLDEFFLVDILVSRRITHWSEAFLTVENLFDTVYEVRTSTSGLVEVGAPRLVQAGIRLNF